jgi:integrase
MGRAAKETTALALKQLKRPGVHAVGNGVYLRITPTGGRTWVFRYTRAGKPHSMGLGPEAAMSLADARAKGYELRKLMGEGDSRILNDPIRHRRHTRSQQALAEAREVVFKCFADDFLNTHESAWKNPKHKSQWRATLEAYVFPAIGDISVADIGRDEVLGVLQPIWLRIPETARRVRGRLEAILDAAEAKGLRDGKNPAELKTLRHLLPRHPRRDGHHSALPWAELPAFAEALRAQEGIGARATEFTILTAARTGEVIGAEWNEIDLDAKLWTVPAKRMKAGREHCVPLPGRAIEILKRLPREDGNRYLFIGGRRGLPLSNMAMLETLRRMGRADITVHGFRSTFRDWAAETTSTPNHVVEMALAHTVGDKVEAAYRRGNLLMKRRKLMDAWERFAAADGKVLRLRA